MLDPRPLHRSALDAHAERRPDALALVAVDAAGGSARWTFGELALASRRMARHLREHEGVARGDRVVVILPQRAESPIVHTACSRLGAIATPLSPLFGPDGLASRLADAKPRLVITHAPRESVVREAMRLARLAEVRVRLVDDPAFAAAWQREDPLLASEEAAIGPEDPTFLVYTSGTTGGPKGVLLPQRVLPGRMPGFLLAQQPFEPLARETRFYSPADWSWIGGLLDALFAPWYAGAAVVAHERAGHFDAASALRLFAETGVTNAFLPPTALKALARSGVPVPPGLALRVVHSAGEPLPPPVAQWARTRLARAVATVYGLTEAAFLIGTAAGDSAVPEGSMGRPYPGHRVELRDEEIVVARGDPTLMLGYWQGPDRPPLLPLDAEGFLHTGDLASRHADGWFHSLGRKDDLIKTSGHRVGPAEVEACLLLHPAVAECGVVGVPDAERGERVKAFVKLAPGHVAGAKLEEEIREFVRARLAAHMYPREIAFVGELPLTVTGKLRRRELRAP